MSTTKDEKPWQDEEWLRKKTIDEGMSSYELAKGRDVSAAGIRYWLDQFEIPRESAKEYEINKENLRRWYWDEEKTQLEISKLVGCSRKTISNHLEKHEIPTRDQSTYQSLALGGDGSGVNYMMDRKGHMYWSVTEDDGPKRVSIHRLQMVAKYGFESVKDRHVHHVNHCSWDNRDENFEAMTGSNHLSYHANIREDNRDPPWAEFDEYDGFSKEELGKTITDLHGENRNDKPTQP